MRLGSTVVYPYDDLSLEPVELGASIFVKANKNMWRAIEEFGLETTDFEDDDSTLGIWDGEQFLLTVSPTDVCSGMPQAKLLIVRVDGRAQLLLRLVRYTQDRLALWY